MRKVTTINLNHNAYQIDEDGYEILRKYLEDAEHALADNPDRAEIMADLEQAIADKCRVTLGQYKSVVSAAEIERILKEMGPVVGSAEQAGATDSAAGADAGNATGTPPRPRRLYRILEGKQLTGVCNGLAAYAGVDVTWVRVAFVLLTVFSGVGLIVYIVMSFAMPVANSPEEVAAAHGQPFNAQELVDRVKQKHEDFRAERRANRERKRRGQWFAAQTGAPVGVPPAPPGAAARVAGGVMLPLFTVVSAVWFAAMAVAAIIAWHLHLQPGAYWLHGHEHLAHLPRWIPLIAVIAIYALIALPISAARRAALYYANGGHSHGWADAWSGLLWIALVAVLLVVAWQVMPQLQEILHDVFDWPMTAHIVTWT
jgi:phage shock protein PspC (stress-responsive transcriptional regulator)